MQQQTNKPTFVELTNLGSPIVQITSCKNYFAALCQDQSFRIWQNNFEGTSKKPILQNKSELSVNCISFNKNSTKIALCSIDSTIKIWDLDHKSWNTLPDQNFPAARIAFAGYSIFGCGDAGKFQFYDFITEDKSKKMDAGDAFLNVIAVSQDQNKIAVGNVCGDVYLINSQTKQKQANFKPHYKTIRAIKFSNDRTKLLVGSDDGRVSRTDLQSQSDPQMFEGHTEKVTGVGNHPRDPHIFYSCSYDQTIKTWDTRLKDAVNQIKLNMKLQAMQITGKRMLVGGQSFHLQFFTI